MKQNIICPYCDTDRDCSELSRRERVLIFCFFCNEEIGEIIPKSDYFYEFCHFVFNCLVYVFLLGLSAYFFETSNDWKNFSGFIFIFSLMIASISLHEFFHAFFAFLLGDYSVFREGYLRLNFFKYVQTIDSIVLPAIIFLFVGVFFPGGAVYIQEENIRNRISIFIVYISGVFSQVIFIFTILILIDSDLHFLSDDFKSLLHVSAFIQVLILIANLLPIPGYDGWNAIFSLISREIGEIFSRLSTPIVIAFLGIIVFDLFPGKVESIFLILMEAVKKIGLDEDLVMSGWSYLIFIDIETLDLFWR